MQNTINYQENQETEIEKRLSALLKTPWLDKILELTYAYKPTYEINWRNIYFNKDIFETFLWKKFPEKPELSQEEFKELENSVREKAIKVLEDFNAILKEIIVSNEVNDSKKELIINAINYNITLIQYFLNSLVFELKKAWYKRYLTKSQIKLIVKRNEEYEKVLYWWKIIDNEEEALRCYDYMVTEAEKNKDKITPERYNKLQEYLEKIRKELESRWYEVWMKFVYDKKENKETKDFRDAFWKTEIDRETYMQIFDMVFESLWLRQRTRLTSAWSVYDWPDFLDIPDNDKFAKLPLDRILKLVTHEILWHYISQRNHEKYFWNIRGEWNVEKDEWMAMLLEAIMHRWEDIFSVNPVSPEFTTLLAWEILESNEYLNFIDIYWDVTRKLTTNEARFIRYKRNQPINWIWVQHKDTTYIRWLLKIIDYLKSWWDIFKLINWKFWIKDITSWKIDFSQNKDFLITFFIVDIIIYKVLQKKWLIKEKLNRNTFKEYLKRKYHYLWIDFDSLLNDANKFQKLIANKVFKVIENRIESTQSPNPQS